MTGMLPHPDRMEERLESLRRNFRLYSYSHGLLFERRIERKEQELRTVVQCSRAPISAFRSLAHENLMDGRTAKKGPK